MLSMWTMRVRGSITMLISKAEVEMESYKMEGIASKAKGDRKMYQR